MQSEKIKSITSDRDRLSANQAELMAEIDTFKTKDGLNAAKVRKRVNLDRIGVQKVS